MNRHGSQHSFVGAMPTTVFAEMRVVTTGSHELTTPILWQCYMPTKQCNGFCMIEYFT